MVNLRCDVKPFGNQKFRCSIIVEGEDDYQFDFSKDDKVHHVVGEHVGRDQLGPYKGQCGMIYVDRASGFTVYYFNKKESVMKTIHQTSINTKKISSSSKQAINTSIKSNTNNKIPKKSIDDWDDDDLDLELEKEIDAMDMDLDLDAEIDNMDIDLDMDDDEDIKTSNKIKSKPVSSSNSISSNAAKSTTTTTTSSSKPPISTKSTVEKKPIPAPPVVKKMSVVDDDDDFFSATPAVPPKLEKKVTSTSVANTPSSKPDILSKTKPSSSSSSSAKDKETTSEGQGSASKLKTKKVSVTKMKVESSEWEDF
jgi:hypothetical protein